MMSEYGSAICYKSSTDVYSEALLFHISTGNKAQVYTLLESKEVDINHRDMNGYTPLSWAADRGHADIVKHILASKETDVNHKDNNGYTALMWAADLGNTKVVKIIYIYIYE